MNQGDVQCAVLGYLRNRETLNHLEARRRPDLDSLMGDLYSFETKATWMFQSYSRMFPASKWAMDEAGIPPWASAGLAAGIYGKIANPQHLIALAGMDSKRYISPEEAKGMMAEVARDMGVKFQNRHDIIFTEAMILELNRRFDRNPNTLPPDGSSWDEVFHWATHKTHSEFLRTISINLGAFFEKDADTKYHGIYEDVLDVENEKVLRQGKTIMLGQITHRAKASAVRSFLSDYYRRIQEKAA